MTVFPRAAARRHARREEPAAQALSRRAFAARAPPATDALQLTVSRQPMWCTTQPWVKGISHRIAEEFRRQHGARDHSS